MKQLLKFEFRKLFRMKSLYICSAVIVLLTLFTFGALKIMEMIMTNGEIMSAVGITELSVTGMEFLNAKYCMVSALSGTDISILISIVVALLFCTDFSTGAIKNIVAKGYSRISIFFAKYIASVAASVILTAVCWLSGFVIGFSFWGEIGDDWIVSVLIIMGVQLLIMLAYCSIVCAFSALFKRTAIVIVLSIFLPTVLEVVLLVVDIVINSPTFSVSSYWLSSCLYDISYISAQSADIVRAAVTSGVYIAVLTAVGVFASNKSEV